MRPVVAIVAMLVGCGRFHFDATSGGDAGPSDAPAHVDDGGTATCNSVARIADTFATDQRATLWAGSYFDGTSSATASGGKLTLAGQANADDSYGAFRTLSFYDLRGARTFVRVNQVASAGAVTGFGVEWSQAAYLHIEQATGTLSAIVEVNGMITETAQIPYLVGTHVYWAISERAGRIYFETSTDGVTFATFYELAAPFDVSL
ncbi:MAG TPA: hypothetical protein VGC41_29700, partial [Kofleriaceae bacterium]